MVQIIDSVSTWPVSVTNATSSRSVSEMSLDRWTLRVSDVWVVESPPEFKGHPTTPTCTHQLPLQWTRLRQGEGVVCLGVKGRVRHTQCRASAVRMKKCLKTCGELE